MGSFSVRDPVHKLTVSQFLSIQNSSPKPLNLSYKF